MNKIVGDRDILSIALDTLPCYVAVELLAARSYPNLAKVLPSKGWEKRHSAGNFTYAAGFFYPFALLFLNFYVMLLDNGNITKNF